MRSVPLFPPHGERRLLAGVLCLSGMILAAAVGSGQARAATFGWASKAGISGQGRAVDVAALSDGSSVVVGSFRGTATFGSTVLLSSGSGTDDVFVAKVNADGTYAWATRAGGTGNDNGVGIAVSPEGTAIITGTFTGPAPFGLTSLTSSGGTDAFVAKLSPSGTFVWATKVGSSAGGYAQAVAVLSDGSAIVGGSFYGSAAFGALADLTSAGSADAYVAKLDADGAFLWATRAGDTQWDSTGAVSVLSNGAAIVAGSFRGTASFGSTPAITAAGFGDAFVARVDPDGAFAWATPAGGATSDDDAYGVAALPDGSSIVTGSFQGTVATPAVFGGTTLASAGFDDIFVARVSAAGAVTSAVGAGGTGSDFGMGVAALPDGAAMVAGEFRGTNASPAAFGPTQLVSAGSDDAFVAKVDAAGVFSQVTRAGGTGADDGTAVAVRPDGTSLVTGSFSETATFDFAAPLVTAGQGDGFVAQFVPGPRAPQAPTAVAGVGEATVTVTPLADASVTSYTVAAAPGGAACTVTLPAVSCTVTGLSGGTPYTFSATATNAEGTSLASARSASVTPADAPSPAGAAPGVPAGQQASSAPALSVGLRASARSVRSGRLLTVTVRMTNGGPVAVESARACVNLPAGLAFVRATGATRKGRTVCSAPKRLAIGATATQQVTVRATGSRRVQRTVSGWATGTGAPRADSLPVAVRIRPR